MIPDRFRPITVTFSMIVVRPRSIAGRFSVIPESVSVIPGTFSVILGSLRVIGGSLSVIGENLQSIAITLCVIASTRQGHSKKRLFVRFFSRKSLHQWFERHDHECGNVFGTL
jgi:hypothetical protein